ncbi:MAG: glycosyltransferase family 4 protein [Terracidiphilus sp.]|jgi:glycosyltransferase involved in cell wall biosynthesis
MRICIVAEHASKRFGGEAFLPVHYFSLLRSRGEEAWLVVHSRTQSELRELFPQDFDRILFVPDLWIHKFFFSLGRYLPRRLSEATFGLFNQLITQLCQRSILRELIRNNHIDVIHQVIPVAPRFPSALFGLAAPLVIGPLNGGMEYPPAFHNTESRMSRAAIILARLLVNVGNTVLPGKKQASVVLVANDRTRRALPSGLRGRVIEMAENGIDIGVWQGTPGRAEGAASRFVFMGRLVDWKVVDVVIRALKMVPAANLEVIGDGPMLDAWKLLAGQLGVADRVQFVGWLPQQECADRVRGSVALVLPSIYECGGAVVLEAMAMGRPVIATDWGGPSDYLDASTGILVAPTSYSGLVTGFAEAMQKLIHSPKQANSMGAAGHERALRDFDWQRRIDRMIGIYRALAEKSDVPRELTENPAPSVTVSEQH